MGVEGSLPQALPSIRYHDEQIARGVLAHFLNLGTQTGSWALGTTFADFFVSSLNAVADDIAEVASQHIVEDLVDINFGADEPAPRVLPDEIGSKQIATAQALKLLFDAGILRPDRSLEEAVRQTYDLPSKDTSALQRCRGPLHQPCRPSRMGGCRESSARWPRSVIGRRMDPSLGRERGPDVFWAASWQHSFTTSRRRFGHSTSVARPS
jgi:hypothetical protein